MLKNIVIERVEQKFDLRSSIEYLLLGKKYSHKKNIYINLRYILKTPSYYNKFSGYFYTRYGTSSTYEKNHLYHNYRRPTINELFWLVLNIMSGEECF